jgi:hypothetical protein
MLRDQDEMSVSDAEAVHQKADAQRCEDGPNTPADALRRAHDVGGHRVVEIGEVIDVLLRYHKTFTWCRGPDGHEGHDHSVLVNHARGALSPDDLAEDAGFHTTTRDRKAA